MNAVEKRIHNQLGADTKAAKATAKTLGATHDKLMGEAQKLVAGHLELVNELGKQDAPSAKATATVSDLPRLARVERDLLAVGLKLAAAKERVAALENGDEVSRRIALAKRLGVGDDPMPGPQAALVVLTKEGTAMPVERITRTMLEAGMVELSGKTPEQTVSAYLAKAAKKGDQFVRVNPGEFDLKDRPKKAAAKAAPKKEKAAA